MSDEELLMVYGQLLLDKKDADREVRIIEDHIREHVAKMVNAALGVEYDPGVLEVGAWDCLKSPLESCVYNDNKDDPNHDFCLFCGQTEERK